MEAALLLESYVPRDARVVIEASVVLVGLVAASAALALLRSAAAARALAWLGFVGGVVAVERITAAEGAGFRMLALIAAGLLGMKAVVRAEAFARGRAPLSLVRWLAFATLWPGMNPSTVARRHDHARAGAWRLIAAGIRNTGIGLACILVARVLWDSNGSSLPARAGATALALVGLSLTLHFGVFHAATGAWRLAGFDCRALFRTPIRSRTLSEFWSRRWNLAFSEMTALAVYRPLTRAGRGFALAMSFVFSGLLHEMAISLPVRTGFGLPLLYFALQLAAVSIERIAGWSDRPPRAWKGRLWTLGWLLLPLPFLFHLAFLEAVVWPLLDTG